MSLFTELFDVFFKHQLESIVLLFFIVFAYKFFFGNGWTARENRHEFNRWITRDVPFNIEYFFRHCVYNPNSYSGLNDEKFNDVLELLKILPQMNTWAFYDFITAKLRLQKHETMRIIKALEDLKKITFNDYHIELVQEN